MASGQQEAAMKSAQNEATMRRRALKKDNLIWSVFDIISKQKQKATGKIGIGAMSWTNLK